MKFKKFMLLALSAAMLTACSAPSEPQPNQEVEAPKDTQANKETTDEGAKQTEETPKQEEKDTSSEEVQSTYTLNYPSNMQEKGFTEPVVLEEKPSRAVCMSNAAVLALYEMGIDMVGIPKTSVVEWPDDLKAQATELSIAMNKNFDIESVIALDPDFVVMGYTKLDTYGKVLTDANIPVYYVDDGHTVTYDSIKMLTDELIGAFGKGTENANAIQESFKELESRLEGLQEENEGKQVMVLQSSPPNHYIQTKSGTLGSMLDMMGYTNVYESDAGSMAPLDFEQAITYTPDLVFAVGSAKTSEEFQVVMEEDFQNNEAFWNSIEAIKNEDIIYLPVNFISSAGINVVENINTLIDIIEEKDAE